MKAWLLKFLNFYLYSSLHISIAVATLIVWAYYLAVLPFDWIYILFCFASTLLMYTIHRIYGLQKIPSVILDPRFEKIRKFKTHLIIFGLLAFIIGLFSFFRLTYTQKTSLFIPIFVSTLYAVPLISKKRVRDIPFIKIFLIAFIWAWITVWIPLIDSDFSNYESLLLCFERFLFIFAITVPFDVRDLKVDKASSLKTIPQIIGVRISIALAILLLCFASLINFTLWQQEVYSIAVLFASLLSYLLVAWIISNTHTKQSDYFYSGILDATMISHSIILFLSMKLLS